ncbi:iron chelate uptake ABC transporter family permease subunit [Agrobacterium tumefaciens]|uniref:iron chelate uptake ABC transporter family permease subunit n=1 Tax=Agrobacterium tumefaciens TaxID=358 RepID=UPI003B9F9F26
MRDPVIFRTRAFSRQVNLNTAAVAALLMLVCLGIAMASLAIGKHVIGPTDVVTALIGEGPRRDTFIIEILRMPRLLMACMVGAALALSGLILQSVVRNPLASPDILGITGGASAAAVGVV